MEKWNEIWSDLTTGTVTLQREWIKVDHIGRLTIDGMRTSTIATAKEIAHRIENCIYSNLAWLIARTLLWQKGTQSNKQRVGDCWWLLVTVGV